MDESIENQSRIQIGDFVWAKMKGFPSWPGRVMTPTSNVPPKPALKDTSKEVFWIYFFGSHNYAWIDESNIKPYDSFKEKFSGLSKNVGFKEAVAEIEEILSNLRENPGYVIDYIDYVSEARKSVKRKSTTPSVKRTLKDTTNTIPTKKKRRSLSNESGEGSSENDVTFDQSDGTLERTKEIVASKKIFGFLGMGMMGSAIVKNLLASGHKVNIWNRSSYKCDEILNYPVYQEGFVKQYETPYEILQNSDIIFSCLSEPEVCKTLIQKHFRVDDVDDTSLEGKGYVEITGIDAESSMDICEMIENKGGKYVEVQVQGSKQEAQEGSLVVLCAGNNELFLECQSCFKAIGKTSFFLGPVGYACKTNLVIQLMKAVCLVGLSEGLALADRCGISAEEFVNIFNLTTLANPYMTRKANIIINKTFAHAEQALQYMQKDVKLGLDLSNRMKQPMVVASAANEIFKYARRLGYDGHDASCVYIRSRH